MPFDIQPSPEIEHRDDFPILCIWRKFNRAVEIGIDRAEFSQMFLNRWADFGELYLGIDPYDKYSEMGWNRDGDKEVASIRYERFAAKAKLIIAGSVEVSNKLIAIKDENGMYGSPYDFIYIDGDHSKDAVTRDLDAWWPLVSDRGIIAGHDWDMKSGDHPGVKETVTRFAKDKNLTIYFTKDDPQSWYIYRNGIPGPAWRRI